jgi:hypothetical protein
MNGRGWVLRTAAPSGTGKPIMQHTGSFRITGILRLTPLPPVFRLWGCSRLLPLWPSFDVSPWFCKQGVLPIGGVFGTLHSDPSLSGHIR